MSRDEARQLATAYLNSFLEPWEFKGDEPCTERLVALLLKVAREAERPQAYTEYINKLAALGHNKTEF